MKTSIAICSNIWTKMVHLKKGEIWAGHKHHFDHVHLLSVGKIKITIGGINTIYEAPAQIIIKKEIIHGFECLSDTSLGICIHAIRGGDAIEDIFDPDMCPDYLEGDEAKAIYPTSQIVDK